MASISVASAGPRRWTTQGPQGGSASSIVVSPSNPDVLCAGGVGGVFKSVDGGLHWNVVNDRLTYVLLAIDPAHPRTVYAATGRSHAVWKTTDAGATWHTADTGLPTGDQDFTPTQAFALEIDPVHPDTLYVAAGNEGFTSDCTAGWGVYRTRDGGAHWYDSSSGMADSQIIDAFAVTPRAGSRVYAGASGRGCGGTGGLFVSDDHGATWTHSDTGIGTQDVGAIEVDPLNADVVYAATDTQVYRSTDAGATWVLSDAGMETAAPTSLAVDTLDDDNVYAGTYQGVYKSTDAGITWHLMDTGMEGRAAFDVAVDPAKPFTLFAASSGPGVVFRSTDAAASWTGATRFVDTTVDGVVAAPSDPMTLYAWEFTTIGRSSDGGRTWAFSDDGLPTGQNEYIRDVAVNPRDPDVAYVATTIDGIYKTTDGGATWQPANDGIHLTACAVAVDPNHPNVVWAGVAAAGTKDHVGLYKSTDGGQTWHPAGDGLSRTVVGVTLDPRSPDTVYATSAGCCIVPQGVYKTTDGGGHWRRMSPKGTRFVPTTIGVAPSQHRTVYALDYNQVWRTTNAGGTWTEIERGMPTGRLTGLFSDLTVAGGGASTAFAATRRGVFRTDDGGRHWRKWSDGLGVRFATVIARSGHHLYVSTSGGGVYERDI